jgi:hypothetical protein
MTLWPALYRTIRRAHAGDMCLYCEARDHWAGSERCPLKDFAAIGPGGIKDMKKQITELESTLREARLESSARFDAVKTARAETETLRGQLGEAHAKLAAQAAPQMADLLARVTALEAAQGGGPPGGGGGGAPAAVAAAAAAGDDMDDADADEEEEDEQGCRYIGGGRGSVNQSPATPARDCQQFQVVQEESFGSSVRLASNWLWG